MKDSPRSYGARKCGSVAVPGFHSPPHEQKPVRGDPALGYFRVLPPGERISILSFGSEANQLQKRRIRDAIALRLGLAVTLGEARLFFKCLQPSFPHRQSTPKKDRAFTRLKGETWGTHGRAD